ncbi:LppU/SCO3897 family protein [Mycobacterium attenuatum]|uniref:LppU/SCO3897 family protein n=1 Tax=Mycobacterium attenuatum TaxID=2341086 RepID=UPI003CC80175
MPGRSARGFGLRRAHRQGRHVVSRPEFETRSVLPANGRPSSHQLLSPVDCDDVRYAQLRVAQRVDGSTGTARCPDGATLISYPYPARLYCMTPVGSQPPG